MQFHCDTSFVFEKFLHIPHSMAKKWIQFKSEHFDNYIFTIWNKWRHSQLHGYWNEKWISRAELHGHWTDDSERKREINELWTTKMKINIKLLIWRRCQHQRFSAFLSRNGLILPFWFGCLSMVLPLLSLLLLLLALNRTHTKCSYNWSELIAQCRRHYAMCVVYLLLFYLIQRIYTHTLHSAVRLVCEFRFRF